MKKILFLFIFLILFWPVKVLAADLTVTCPHDGPKCTMNPSSGAALFNESNFFPGGSITRNITFLNEDPNYTCPLTLQVSKFSQNPADFMVKLFTEIKDGLTTVYGGGTTTLDTLSHSGTITLGNIPANGSKTYVWLVTFDPQADNAYQGAEADFDFKLTFSCGEPEVSPSPSPSGGGSNGGGGGTGAGAGEGGPSASPTDWASFVFGAATGFYETILPSSEEKVEGATAQQTSSPGPEVKGVQTSCGWWNYFWWLPLAIQFILTIIYVSGLKKRRKQGDYIPWYFWLPVFLLAILSQIIHGILGCECVLGRLCSWYWLFNVLILVASIFYYHFRKDKENDD